MQRSGGTDVGLVAVAGGFSGAAIAAVIVFSLWNFLTAPQTPIAAPDKYDLLRDLLLIGFGLAAAAGVVGYKVLQHLLRDSLERELQDRAAKLEKDYTAKIMDTHVEMYRSTYLNLGLLAYWVAEMAADPSSRRRLKEWAVRYTRQALEGKLPSSEQEERRTITLKNNLAYYLAATHLQERNRWDLKGAAEQLAEEVRSSYEKLRNPRFLETHAYVKTMFARTPEEIAQAKETIKSYLSIPELEPMRSDLEKSLAYLENPAL